MSDFREEMEAKTGLYTTGTSPTLSSITLSHERVDQSTDLTLLVEATQVSDIYMGCTRESRHTASPSAYQCR